MKILLTSCTRNTALVVMRALARSGHEVIACDERALRFGLHSRFATCFERLPAATSEDFSEALLRIVRRHRPDVLLPIMGSQIVSRERERFQRETHVLVPSLEAYAALGNKRALLERCSQVGIPHPRLLTLEQARHNLVSERVPGVVIKPCRDLGGGRGVSIVTDVHQVGPVHEAVTRAHGDALISEYIPGADSNNFALHVALDRDSRLICAFAYRKTRLSPLRTGVTAAGISIHASRLVDLVLPLLQQLRWAGPADIEFKLDEHDQQMKLVEINPRFSGAVAFPIGCGVNLPELVCRAAAGDSLAEATGREYAEGIKYWNPPWYMRSVTQELLQRRAPLALFHHILRELTGTRVGNPYALSDPAPILGKLLSQPCPRGVGPGEPG